VSAVRAIRCLVAGRVQRVFYRAATAAEAERLGLDGTARNLADGRVEVVVRGDEAALTTLVRWLWQGPPAARVDAVQIAECLEPIEPGFHVLR
jgi:acylphosphatase